jgi:nucleotide-binding universal stress UspA family protein
MFRKVIVGFDGSDRAQDALALATALTAPDGELIVCCVHHFQSLSARIDPTEPSIDRESAQAMADQATQLLGGSLNVTSRLLAAVSAATGLQSIATEEQAELIVLGSSHRGTLGRVFMGSVTQETLHEASCPVAVPPVGFHDRQARDPIKRIAVGHDAVEPTPGALAAAISLCQQACAELLLVAIAEDATIEDPKRETMSYEAVTELRLHATENSVGETLARVPQSISPSSEVLDGDPAEQLVAASRDADLLVLGSHDRGFLGRLIMGSVSDRVVRSATCPVLVIPASANATDANQRVPSTIGADHES